MPGEVDLEVHFYALVAAEFLDAEEVVGGPDEVWAVGSFGGEVGERRDLERPGLGVGGVKVEAIEFLKGHGAKGTDDIVGGDIVSRDI